MAEVIGIHAVSTHVAKTVGLMPNQLKLEKFTRIVISLSTLILKRSNGNCGEAHGRIWLAYMKKQLA